MAGEMGAWLGVFEGVDGVVGGIGVAGRRREIFGCEQGLPARVRCRADWGVIQPEVFRLRLGGGATFADRVKDCA